MSRQESFGSSRGIVKKQGSPDGGCGRVKTFIIAMRDISRSLLASTALKIFTLDINCLSQVMDFSFFKPQVQFYVAELNMEEVCNEC